MAIRGSVTSSHAGESIAGSRVYLDANDNGRRDEDELVALSDADGLFAFEGLVPGRYVVRQDLGFGWRRETDKHERARRPSGSSLPDATPGTAHIIGGSDAVAGRYPFMVSLGELYSFNGISEDYFHFCGGALVSDRFILTAAHCSEGAEPGAVVAKLGVQDASEPAPVAEIAAITVHPDFDGDVSAGFDFALWELAQPLDLEALGLRTIDLAQEQDSTSGQLATTIGWGVSDNASTGLQEVHVPVVSEDVCSAAYPEVASFATQLCAGASLGGLDSCQGDSGGPLMIRDQAAGRWLHAGVTSWGEGCAEAGKPGIYGRTAAVSQWAHNLMTEKSSQGFVVDLQTHEVELGFVNEPTTRPLLETLDARYSVSALTLLSGNDNKVAANANVRMNFFIHSDSDESRALQCSVDPDGAGPARSSLVDCAPGVNQLALEGYSDGIYQPTLTVETRLVAYTRSTTIVAGTPSGEAIEGTISQSDAADPDWILFGTYFIDYFELSDAQAGQIALVEVESSFAVQLTIYDADLRSEGGGGELQTATGDQSASLLFVPEEGKRYLIGISTLFDSEVGDYTLSVLNNGSVLAMD